MKDVPAGFTVVQKGWSGGKATKKKDELRASVSPFGLTFSGAARPRFIGKSVVIAVNGTRFAITESESINAYPVQKNGLTGSGKAVKDIAVGRYVGVDDGEWTIFSPVEGGA